MKTGPLQSVAEREASESALLSMACRMGKLGGWVVSVAGQAVTWSDQTAAIHDEPAGFSPPSVEAALAYCKPEYRELLRRAFEDCAKRGGSLDSELALITARGRHVWVRSLCEAVRDAAGEITHVQGVFQDISAQKLAVIQSLAARLHDTLETLPDAFFTLNHDWRFTYLNGQAESLLERDGVHLLDRSIWQEFESAAGTASEHAYRQAMAGVAARFEHFYPALERWFSVDAYPARGGIAVYLRDITEQHKQREALLAQVENKYRALLEAAPDAMLVVNERGEIVLSNARTEELFGYRCEELVGQQVKSIVPDGFAERLQLVDTQTAAEGRGQPVPLGIELTGRREDGRDFPIQIVLTPLESAERVLIAVAICDISARRDAETHLAQMEGERRVSGEALRESEERYRMLLDGLQDHAVFMMDPDGRVMSWNAGAERIKGYRADEILGRSFSCFFPAEDVARGRPAEVLRLAAESGRHEELGMRVRKDGSRFLGSLIFTALRDAAGTLRGFSEFSHDLSESKASGAKYRGLLEAAPDSMVVVNKSGEIVLLNARAENQFGYRRDELVGQQVSNIIPQGFAERLIADGTRTAAEALAQQIGTGIELSGRSKDGREFPIEIMLSPLESVEGILVTVAIRDISVRKAAEKHLSQMKGRYRGLLEAAPDPMVLVNQAGMVVLVNLQAEKVFGYEREELVGASPRKLISPDSVERLARHTQRSPDGGFAEQSRSAIELDGCHKSGSGFPIEVMLSPLQTDEGTLLAVAIRDISTRKKAEAQLLQTLAELNRSNEELGQFAYIASHDLQEPLRMVASYTQLLSKRYKGKLDADADQFIAFAVDGAQRMQQLIQDLLAYSHVGTKGNELLETSSEDALKYAIANLAGAIKDSGALVTHEPLPPVLADGGQLVQLFQNLVGNAIKYQRPGIPRVHISSLKDGEAKWQFSVTDNGLGIDPQYFERIFGMFQRLHGRDEFEGTGIGLAICKKIVERHGGRLSVESQTGHGSTFRFALAHRGAI